MPSTPAMTTGMIDFITRSGFMTPIDDTPTPDLAVPYAAPRSAWAGDQGAPAPVSRASRRATTPPRVRATKLAVQEKGRAARTGKDESDRGAHEAEEGRGGGAEVGHL